MALATALSAVNARVQRRHDTAQRLVDKRADHYLSVFRLAHQIVHTTSELMPRARFEGDEDRAPAVLPSIDEQLEAAAIVGLFGSSEVRSRFDSFRTAVRALTQTAWEYEALERDMREAGGRPEPELVAARRTLRKAEPEQRLTITTTLEALRLAMVADLNAAGDAKPPVATAP